MKVSELTGSVLLLVYEWSIALRDILPGLPKIRKVNGSKQESV